MKPLKFIKLIGLLSLFTLLFGCASHEKTTAELYKNKSAKEILVAAEKAMAKNNYVESSKHFEAIDSLYPFGDEAEKAQREVIYVYYQNGDYGSALAAADRYIHLYPRGKYTPYAYYMKGISNFESSTNWLQKITHNDPADVELKNLQSAFANFNDLVRFFPDSIYAQDARIRMIYIRNMLAAHEVNTANFYYKRKAYVAAINRAAYVVQHFQGAPQVEEALKVLAKSYRALGDTKSEEQAKKLLKINFPEGQKI